MLKARLREQPLPLSLPDSYLGRHRIIGPDSFAVARLAVPFEPLGTNFNMPESDPEVKKEMRYSHKYISSVMNGLEGRVGAVCVNKSNRDRFVLSLPRRDSFRRRVIRAIRIARPILV